MYEIRQYKGEKLKIQNEFKYKNIIDKSRNRIY